MKEFDVMDRNLDVMTALLDPCLTTGEAIREGIARWHSRESEPRREAVEYPHPRAERRVGENGTRINAG